MRPFSAAPFRSAALTDTDREEDLDATVSFSDSDDGLPDPPVLQKLAQALLAWNPALVPAYARIDHVPEELAPFAAFLVQLRKELQGRAASCGEVIGWLQALAADDAARRRAFRIASGADGAGTAMETYRAIRNAAQ